MIIIILLILIIQSQSVFSSLQYYQEGLGGVSYRDMIMITGGTFTQKTVDRMGDIYKFQHTISDLEIGKYEVTYELWYTVYKWAISNGYIFENAGKEGHDGEKGSPPSSWGYEPVTDISWYDALVWCNAYSEMSSYQPVYYDSSGLLIKSSIINNADLIEYIQYIRPRWEANGYRLPTEGEWQYCASDAGALPYNYASGAVGNWKDLKANDMVAWFDENSGKMTHHVGMKKPNGFGLHDMSGNVWEICWDRYDKYPYNPQIDYKGSEEGFAIVVRGGSWKDYNMCLRVGHRRKAGLKNNSLTLGLRIARRP